MVKRVIVVACGVLLATVCVYLIAIVAVRSAIQAEIQKIRAKGYPVTGEELNAWAGDSSAKNSADAYLHAFDLVNREVPNIDANTLPFASRDSLPKLPLTGATLASVQIFLDAKKEARTALIDAASRGPCHFPIETTQLENFDKVDISYLVSNRKSVQVLILFAITQADGAAGTGLLPEKVNSSHEGADFVVESLLAAVATARTLEDEPLLISQLVRASDFLAILPVLEYILNKVEFTDAHLRQISNAFALAETDNSFERAYAGERCIGIANFPAERPIESNGASPALTERLYEMLQVRVYDEEYYLRAMRRLIAAAAQPAHERLRAYDAVRPQLESTPAYFPISRRIFVNFAKGTAVDLQVLAQLRVARVAAAVQRYRIATKTLPESLDQLLPTYLDVVPADPWSHSPIRYSRVGIRAVVFSTGKNGVDDDGRGDDIAVSVQR